MLTDYTPIDRLIDTIEAYVKDSEPLNLSGDLKWDTWEDGHLVGLKDALATAIDYRDRYGPGTA